MYIRDLAIALMKLGHFPLAYSPVLGEVAEELKRATVPVIDDLRSLNEPPDLIHGQHHLETMMAVLHFPRTPAVFFCHGWLPWEELPPVFPSILRYVAVDDLCRERLLTTEGISPTSISVIYNFVDLERFKARGDWREAAQSALIFSNYATDNSHARTIRAACLRAGIERVDIAGMGSGNPLANPECVLGDYDVVFAKARCALEAMACGCAVIVADFAGLAGMVTTDNVGRMRTLNFGARTMQGGAVTEESVLRELGRYDADDARRVSKWIRVEADMSSALDRVLSVYADVLADGQENGGNAGPAASDERSAATADYLRCLVPVLKSRYELDHKAHQAVSAGAELIERLAAREAEFALKTHEAAMTQAELSERLAAREAKMALKSQEAITAEAELRERLAAREAEFALKSQETDATQAALAQRLTALEAELLLRTQDAASAQAELAHGLALRDAKFASDLEELARERDHAADRLGMREAELDAIHSSRAWKAIVRYGRLKAWLRRS